MTHINFLSENTANTPQNSGGGTSQYCVSRSEGAQGNVQRDNVQRTKDFWTLSPSGERAMSERRASDDREADQVHRRVSGGQSRLMSQSGCSAVDVPMTSYGAPDEHPISIRWRKVEEPWMEVCCHDFCRTHSEYRQYRYGVGRKSNICSI